MADTGVASRLRSLTAQNVPGVAIPIAGAEGCGERRHAGYADLTGACPHRRTWSPVRKIVTGSPARRFEPTPSADLTGLGQRGTLQPQRTQISHLRGRNVVHS